MSPLERLVAAITKSLPGFGLNVSDAEATRIAAIYLEHRPRLPAAALAELLLRIPQLRWNDEDQGVRKLVMLSLVEHLDGLYFIETYEHDGPNGDEDPDERRGS
jgi:hypothetical protein